MDLALEKMITITKKSPKISRNSQKMDKYIRKDDHIPKLKFWGVTELPPLNRISSRDSQSLGVKRKNRIKRFQREGQKTGSEKNRFSLRSLELAFSSEQEDDDDEITGPCIAGTSPATHREELDQTNTPTNITRTLNYG